MKLIGMPPKHYPNLSGSETKDNMMEKEKKKFLVRCPVLPRKRKEIGS
jgi:hypothetical protein